jgi:hypothetical protein
MRRPPRKFASKFDEADVIARFEGAFANRMLLKMVMLAETDRPFVGRLQSDSAVGAIADMSTLDRHAPAAGHTTKVFAHP